jgi:tetratricopeptide (TPR) repeat protein
VIEQVVAGRFQLLAQAGAGGMGAVYRARDLATGATVAVKILTGREVREAQRFDQEGAILAGLVHPAIVRYITHGIADSGARYIAMEWLDGEDLASRLEREHPTIVETVTLARRTAEALAYAHKRGVVHRDIKPGNLFLSAGSIDRLKVLDFGIARLTSGAGRLTRTGKVIGTPGYMAPELVRGAREITPRADVFSLGCVMFQCLTGRAVFEAEAPTALLAKILLVEAPRVRDLAPQVPASVDECVARMLAKDPIDRLADAGAVLDELDGLGPLGDGRAVGAASAGGATIALTASERRIACVVIAGPSATGERRWSGDTPPAGSRSGTPQLDEEVALAGQLRRLIAIEEELARRHGARVHPLPDGSVVVSLPEQERATDQAARAARCALAMRNALPDVAFVVSTGQGRFSAWSAVGEVIDNGMRLLRGTPPGSIRLDDVAAGMLGARFEVRRDGTAPYLRAERDSIGVERQLLGKATAFVGRGREMSMLTNLYAGTVAESAATPVLVIGSAGVGKSRLRQELVEWVQRQPDRAELLFGGVDSVGAGSPFAMLARAIRRTAGIVDGEPLEARQEKLAARVARHVDREAVNRVTEFLGEIADVRFAEGSEALRTARANPQLMGDGMRRAFEDWLMAECAAHPVLLVLEDLHWGDLGTVSFLDSALRNLHDQPFMVLALARPEVEERFPDIWTARHRQTVRLGPLSPRASEQLVRQALGTIGNDLLARLVDRADGNAFYLEELIRATAAGRADALPDSVLAMVQARLDAEGPDGKRVLRAAAIFGERFTRAGLAALLGGAAGVDDVSDSLERLAAHELVARASTPALEGDVELVFAHALIREAAYAMLTDEDRLLGHRLAGDWLEQAGAADAIVLAEHFRRGAEASRAARWYERAAAQSLSANDLVAAIERAELGIAGGASGEQAGKLRLIAAEAHVWRGELEEAERRALAAAADLPAGGSAWLRALAQAIIAAGKQGRLEAVERQVRLVEDSPLTADPAVRSARIICLAWGANFLVFSGRHLVADPLIATIGALAGERDAALDPQALGLLHQVRAVRASAAGDLGRCLAGLESALQAFEQAGDLRNACAVRTNLGYMYSELGDFQRAEAALRQALLACDRMGLFDLSPAVQHNLGHVLGFGTELAEAERFERMAIEAFGRQGDPRMEGLARVYLAEILIARGDFAGAAGEAATAVGALAVAPSPQVAALGALARARLGGGDLPGGLVAAREAHAALERLGEMEEGESNVRLTYAEALAAAGEHDQAHAALVTARHRLLARADRVGDLGWRHRFLHEVPVNARILALAGEPPPPSAGSSAAA